MGISISDEQFALVLDAGIAHARSDQELPVLRIRRVERLGGMGIRTYIGALGAALLAKATDPLSTR